MKLTVIACDDWSGLWIDGELVYEDHQIGIENITRRVSSDLSFTLEFVPAYDTAAEHLLGEQAGFKGITLDKWISLTQGENA